MPDLMTRFIHDSIKECKEVKEDTDKFNAGQIHALNKILTFWHKNKERLYTRTGNYVPTGDILRQNVGL